MAAFALSALIHLQVFGALGALEALVPHAAPASRPVEIAFEMADGTSPTVATPAPPTPQSAAPDVVAGDLGALADAMIRRWR